ncbi:hypothetical protein GCM10009603_21030 [Nocardiopsis exhalans]
MAQVARPEAVVAHHRRAKVGWSSGLWRLRSGPDVFGVIVEDTKSTHLGSGCVRSYSNENDNHLRHT